MAICHHTWHNRHTCYQLEPEMVPRHQSSTGGFLWPVALWVHHFSIPGEFQSNSLFTWWNMDWCSSTWPINPPSWQSLLTKITATARSTFKRVTYCTPHIATDRFPRSLHLPLINYHSTIPKMNTIKSIQCLNSWKSFNRKKNMFYNIKEGSKCVLPLLRFCFNSCSLLLVLKNVHAIFIGFTVGKETSSSVATKTEESSVTEERIAHILHEASAALRAQQAEESGSDESKPPSQTQVTIALPTWIIHYNPSRWCTVSRRNSHTHTLTHIHLHSPTLQFIHTDTHTDTHTHAHTHTHTHTHKHTCAVGDE